MTTPVSGIISLSDIAVEMGNVSTASINFDFIRGKMKGGITTLALSQLYNLTFYSKNNSGNCNDGNCNCTANCGDSNCTQCFANGNINCVNCDAGVAYLQGNCNCACTYNCVATPASYNCNCGVLCVCDL